MLDDELRQAVVLWLARDWRIVALRGLTGVILGLAIFLWPAMVLEALVLLFGAYVLLNGLGSVITALRYGRKYRYGWVTLLSGFLGVIASVVAVAWPGITTPILIDVMAVWAVLTGICELLAALRLRETVEVEWLLDLSGNATVLGLGGLVSLLFGIMLLVWPGAGTLAMLGLVAGYGLTYGTLLVYLSLRLRRVTHRPHENSQYPTMASMR